MGAQRMVAPVTLLALLTLAGCSSAPAKVKVPPVDTTGLGAALAALSDARLRVELSAFGPLPAGYSLESAGVGDQQPEAPSLVERGSVVHLTMSQSNPMGSPAVLKHHPRFVVVPALRGLSWAEARRKIPAGIWLQVGPVPGLGPIAPDAVYSAYVVTGQSRSPGTKLPYGGVLVKGGYRPTVLRIAIGVR
jgi:hypothetical protein